MGQSESPRHGNWHPVRPASNIPRDRTGGFHPAARTVAKRLDCALTPSDAAMCTRSAALVVSLLSIAAGTSPVRADDWPQWQGQRADR
jgi:hypothetical protein